MKRASLLFVILIPFALAACEQLGIDDPVKVAEKQDAEGRAIGSGCRHSGRPLEDCYTANKKASKAAIFAGWREMDGYMRENKIDTAKAVPEEGEAAPQQGAESPAAAATPPQAATKGAAPHAEPAEKKAPAPGKKAALLRRNAQLT